MFKKILSVLLVLVCVFTICFASTVNSQAIFVVDDAVMLGIAISVCASIALSVGLGIASGQGSVYADTAEYILYHLPSDLYDYVMDENNYQIINGKLTLVFTKTMWERFKNWFANTDLSTIPLTSNLGSIDTSDWLPDNSYYNGYGNTPNYNDYFVCSSSPYHSLSYTYQGISVTWLPSGLLTIQLSDGTLIKYENIFSSLRDPSHEYVLGVSVPNKNNGNIKIVTGQHRYWNGTRNTNDIGNTVTKDNINGWDVSGSYNLLGTTQNLGIVTLPDGRTGSFSYNNGTVSFNGAAICTGVSSLQDYTKGVALTGSILSNVSNDSYVVNTNNNVSTYVKDIETKPVATALPRNGSIENDEVLVLPIRSNLVNPDNPTVPLTKGQVKDREKEGLPITSTVPVVPNMSTETGKDQGITIIAGSAVLDDTPVYNPAYNPSVINPGNETITVTANNDVFPTASSPAQTDAFPTEAESAIVKTGEIVSDIAKDLVTPLSPDDIAKGGNRMKLPALLLQKFPFCIPYDLYNAFGVLLAEPEAPVFTVPFKSSSFGIDTSFTIDFSRYENAAKIVRWFLCVSWTVGLILLTRKVIWK